VTLSGRVRLGAVGYLNARPLVFGLDRHERFAVRFDLPSRCAALLHEGAIDVGLIPSIEYLRGPRPYAIVPGPAIASRGPVASVALYTRRHPKDVRSIAMDTSSRTSVALMTVLARRIFGTSPAAVDLPPDLDAMLETADGALIIGDNALLLDHTAANVQKIDLGELWTNWTGLPFVYAFWAGRPRAVSPDAARALQLARDEGRRRPAEIARAYFADVPERQILGERYLRDNIRYDLGEEELEGLRRFYRYADELGLATYDGHLRFYDAEHPGVD
jgi:chorismate dehydratase